MRRVGTLSLPKGSFNVVTGADLSVAQWDEVIAAVSAGGLVPFLDMAYQGFGSGITEDGAVVAKFAQHSELRVKLHATWPTILHEDAPRDVFWGVCGADQLGRLLCSIRDADLAS